MKSVSQCLPAIGSFLRASKLGPGIHRLMNTVSGVAATFVRRAVIGKKPVALLTIFAAMKVRKVSRLAGKG